MLKKKIVCSSFLEMKLPYGFCSNIKNLVNMEKLRLVGMKSHDCHTILHHLQLQYDQAFKTGQMHNY